MFAAIKFAVFIPYINSTSLLIREFVVGSEKVLFKKVCFTFQ